MGSFKGFLSGFLVSNHLCSPDERTSTGKARKNKSARMGAVQPPQEICDMKHRC